MKRGPYQGRKQNCLCQFAVQRTICNIYEMGRAPRFRAFILQRFRKSMEQSQRSNRCRERINRRRYVTIYGDAFVDLLEYKQKPAPPFVTKKCLSSAFSKMMKCFQRSFRRSSTVLSLSKEDILSKYEVLQSRSILNDFPA